MNILSSHFQAEVDELAEGMGNLQVDANNANSNRF